MRKLLFLGILVLFSNHSIFAQWIQNEALTGGSFINDIISYKGDIYIAINDNGLYRSIDNGDSWSFVDVGYDWTIDRLEIHKDHILAATSGHIFKSIDGNNWEDIEISGSFVKEIHSDGNHLYLATLIGGIFKSEDDGANWIDINDEFTSKGVEAFNKCGDILYAGKSDNSGILFKSIDDGQNWEQIVIEEGKWINEIHSNSNGIYANLTDHILFSSDSSSSWSNITNALTGHRITQLFVQEDTLYVNANGQIFTTIDNGANWKNSQHNISGFNSSVLYVNESNIFVGMWGGGVARNTIDLKEEWSIKNEGLMLNTIHRIGVLRDTIFVGTELTFVRSSPDQGINWAQEVDLYRLKGGDARYMTIFKNNIYAGSGGSGVVKRNNEGVWGKVNEGLPNNLIDDLCSNDKYIFAAVDGEGVFRSADPENGWIKQSSGITSGIRGLYSFGKFVFAGTWDGLFVSEDNGELWTDISNDLPGKSINSLTFIDSTIIISTQNNGAFRSSNFGVEWENISGESIPYLTSYKKTVIKSSGYGNLAISHDLGTIWKTIDQGEFPKTMINTVGFSSENIFVGFGRPGPGIWQRQLHEIFPPAISVEVKEDNELVLREEESIVIESDQPLTQENNEKLDSVSLYSLITVYDSNSNEVEFEADIDSTSMKITIVISAPIDGGKYIVEIDSMTNESGLRSAKFISQEYEFHKNVPPVLSKIQKSSFEKQEIIVSANDFINAYQDSENDPIDLLEIIQVPKNGSLNYGNEILSNNSTISFKDFNNLVYKPNNNFIGKDTVIWNSYDGFDFSSENANIEFTIDAITGFDVDFNSNLSIFPNPTTGQLTSLINNNYYGNYIFKLTNINGRILKEFVVYKTNQELEYVISINGLRSGIYILQIVGNGFNHFQKVIKH